MATIPRFVPISHHDDEIVGVTRGYGEAEKPGDFLDSFAAFVRDNVNKIAALKLVVQRPPRPDPRRPQGTAPCARP